MSKLQRSTRGRPPTARDQGFATAETAVVLPVLFLVLAMAIWVLQAVGAQLQCTDAAAVAARAAARGDTPPAAMSAGRAVAPQGADVEVDYGAELVHVEVSADVRPFGQALARLPAVHVSGRAVAAREDQVAG